MLAGAGKAAAFHQYANMFTGLGMPLPSLGVVASTVIEIGGGLALILGFRVRIVAVLMIIFIVAATLFAHRFWIDPTQLTDFFKNLAIIGGFLMLIIHGPGPIAVTR